MAKSRTHGSFTQLLAAAAPEMRPICVVLRRAVLALHPGCTMIVWPRQRIASFGLGPRKMSDHYAYINPHRAHVNLGFYRGAHLKDPRRLLEGTGKGLRHVKIRELTVARSPALRSLLREALRERRTTLADRARISSGT
jgi:hypothetical protein